MSEISRPAQRRIDAAKEVLKLLDEGLIVQAADELGYLWPAAGDQATDNTFADICCTIKGGEPCKACMDGALLLGHLRVSGKLEDCSKEPSFVARIPGDQWQLNSKKGVQIGLDHIFTRTQLALVEAAYECTSRWSKQRGIRQSRLEVASDWGKCIAPGNSYHGSRYVGEEGKLLLMVAICNNIIANNGEIDFSIAPQVQKETN